MLKFIRLVFFIIGLLLFVLVLPHRDPWNSSNIITSGGIYQNVTIKFPVINRSISKPGIYIFLSELSLLVILVIASPSARKALANLIKFPPRLFRIAIPMAIFLFTIYPTKDGLPIIMYLTVSSIGLLYMLFGIYPVLKWLRPKMRITVVSRISDGFYNIKTRYFMALVFIIPFIITNLCSYFIFSHVPHVQDNIDQLFHARIFLKGHLTVTSHQYREFFDFTHNINNGKWYSEYPPGHTFMLMLGLIIGMPWIINPILGSASIILFYLIAKEIFDEKTARLSALLGIFSPFLFFMSSEFFSHATALFYIALFALFFIKSVMGHISMQAKAILYSLMAGISIGICFNARMLTAVGVAIPYAVYGIFLIIKNPRTYFPRFTVMFLGFLIFLGILLGFNYRTNGHPFLFGYEVLHGKQHNLGFGRGVWGPPHTPLKGLVQNLNDLNAINKYLFEWCIPSTIFAVLLFMYSGRSKWDYILVSSVFSLSFVYFFYWYQGWCFGPRFAYESTLPLVILTARGIIHGPKFLQDMRGPDENDNFHNIRFGLYLTIVFCMLIALFVNVPVLAKHYSNSYWGVNTEVQKAVKREKISNAVIFVGSYYGSVLAENSPLLDSDIIYVRDLGSKNTTMMKYYPDRSYYLADSSNVQEIGDYYFDSGSLITSDSDFEDGTFGSWTVTGNAWGVTDRLRDNRIGKFHAESLVGGEATTGILKSSNFKITGRLIKFLKNGWNRDPLRPNQYLLKDAKSNEVLRTAFPPNQDPFATQFWNVSDLLGREVYIVIVDNDDDTMKKGGFAWIGIDHVVQIK